MDLTLSEKVIIADILNRIVENLHKNELLSRGGNDWYCVKEFRQYFNETQKDKVVALSEQMTNSVNDDFEYYNNMVKAHKSKKS